MSTTTPGLATMKESHSSRSLARSGMSADHHSETGSNAPSSRAGTGSVAPSRGGTIYSGGRSSKRGKAASQSLAMIQSNLLPTPLPAKTCECKAVMKSHLPCRLRQGRGCDPRHKRADQKGQGNCAGFGSRAVLVRLRVKGGGVCFELKEAGGRVGVALYLEQVCKLAHSPVPYPDRPWFTSPSSFHPFLFPFFPHPPCPPFFLLPLPL